MNIHYKSSMKNILFLLASMSFSLIRGMYNRPMSAEEQAAFAAAMRAGAFAMQHAASSSQTASRANSYYGGNVSIVSINGRTTISGAGEHVQLTGRCISKECAVAAFFTRIKLNSSISASIKRVANGAPSIEISGDSAILDKIITSFEGDKLTIGLDSCSYSGDAQLNVTIRVPELIKVSLNGNSSATVTGEFKEITVKTNGSSNAVMQGSAQEAILKANGASGIRALGGFTANAATVKSNGASNIVVCASQTIKMGANGASKISYSGDAKVLKQDSSGASRIIKR